MTMRIGEVLSGLRKCRQELRVFFDFCNRFPMRVGSWRGNYCEAALEHGPCVYTNPRITRPPTVAELIERLEDSIDGREHAGWKGGEYAFTDRTPLHVDNPGVCSHTDITGIVEHAHGVLICTACGVDGVHSERST